ncbi:MAG TPA: SDR family NAD(P)-dependent oxidoreductase [Acidimicrobiales bacterium]|nr:SDR family NAD(P)-dependent oxidoreductase [Acidimicrobiales bacterium]
MSKLSGRRVLVTGGTGFLGSYVVKRLVAEGSKVTAVSSSVSAASPKRLTEVRDSIDLVEANLRDASSLAHVVANVQPELVIHQAAFTHVGKSFSRIDENVQTNIQGTVNLLLALNGNFERFVYVGSGDVYGDAPVPFREDGPVRPASPYAVSKYAAEQFCRMFHQAYGWPITCLRPFNVYGPSQSPDRIIPELIISALSGRDLKMTEGRQTREFMFVEDVAEVFVRALTQPGIDGEVINVSRGEEVSIRELAVTVLELMGNPVQGLFGALDNRPNEIWRMFGDPTKARELLGWTPTTSLTDGLTRTIAWYRDQPSQ